MMSSENLSDDLPDKSTTAPERLKRRVQFKLVATGRRWFSQYFVLQMRERDTKWADAPPRFGFTVTKKMGNAPARNRIRRRLREVVRLCATENARAGHDYVVVGRKGALTAPFSKLAASLSEALVDIHRKPGRKAKRTDMGDENAR